MVSLPVEMLPRLAILASGEGTNLQVILDEVAAGTLPAQVVLVISDRKKANALKRAEHFGCPTIYVSKKQFPEREAFDAEMIRHLRMAQANWILLAGFMRILSPSFVQAYSGRIINIHPALLPNYPGVHSIERAYQNGDSKTGVTVHFVDEGVDTGPIILQEEVAIFPNETLETLTERVHAVEHRIYPEAIRQVLASKNEL